MAGLQKVVTPPVWDEGRGHWDVKRAAPSTRNLNGECGDSMTAVPSAEISRLYGAGFSLLPLGGGDDGKSPLTSFKSADRLPVKRVLGILHSKNSASYGIRLDGLAVIDCDVDDPALVEQMEARFGASPVHVATPRGVHLYYRHDGGTLPNLRGEGFDVDIKRGASSYVVGPHSIRPDSAKYRPVKGALGVDELPPIITGTTTARTKTGAIATGNRNRELSLEAIRMVEAVNDPDELFGNLAFLRDEQCENPSSIPDEELRKIADWAWTKRLEGRVYRDRDSEFRINRNALDMLAGYENASDAIALLVTLQAHHGHISGKTFALNHTSMVKAGHTSLGRRRFNAAIQTLLKSGLLGVAKEYSVGRSHRSYRLLRVQPDLPKVQSIFTAKATR